MLKPNTDPIFAYKPLTRIVTVPGDITSEDWRKALKTDAGISEVYKASPDSAGVKITRLQARALGTSNTGMLALYLTDKNDDLKLFDEFVMNAVATDTPPTIESAALEKDFDDLQLEAGQALWVGVQGTGCEMNITFSMGEFSIPE